MQPVHQIPRLVDTRVCFCDQLSGKQFGCFLMSLKSSDASRWFFEEDEMMRTQEFVMRWSSDPGGPFREIARQQWNFSAPE